MMQLEPYGTYTPRGLVAAMIDVTQKLPDSWLGRRLSFTLRRLVLLLLNGRPVDLLALGVKMRLLPYHNVCEKRILFTPQFFDAEERALLAARIHDGFHFVDVGSNIGGYALFVAGIAGRNARILALEPQPDVFERLTYNISLNPFGTIKAIACAVADKNGELTLFIDPMNRGESSVKIVSADRGISNLKVPAITLQTLLAEEHFDRIDAIKLDVEGAEDLILETFFKEAPESLWPGLLLIERSGARWSIDVQQLLLANRYKVIATTKNNQIYERARHV
jgi:FkbM family methyltransferase